MEDEIRDPRLIQEELSDLQELIREEKLVIAKYPEHTELLILHETSLEREQYLIQELEESLKRFSLGPFDITFSGEPVRRSGILLAFLGRATSSLESIWDLISQQSISKTTSQIRDHTKEISESRNLYLVGVGPGSFRIILSSQQPTIGESIALSSLWKFNKLLDCRDDGELLKEQINILGYKTIVRYKSFLELLYRNETNITFYDKIIPEGFQTKEITKDLAKSIYETLGKVESSPDEDILLRGTIKGVSLISRWFEFLIEESGEKITGTFCQRMESDIKQRFDRTVLAKFRVTKKWVEIKEKFNKKYELIGFEN